MPSPMPLTLQVYEVSLTRPARPPRSRMKAKPVIPREKDKRDVDKAMTNDLNQDLAEAALGLIDALK